MQLNWCRYQRISRGWATWWRRSTRLRRQRSHIAIKICGDRRWDASPEQKHWPDNAEVPILPLFVRPCEPLPLTDREREIVVLVGRGLSNRDIAERLTLSIRTVEGHIYKAMGKTDTASREELASLLPDHMPQADD